MQGPKVKMLQFTAVAIIAALAVGSVPGQAAASAAAPTRSESSFRLRPGKDRVDVRVTMSITNRKSDSSTTAPCPNAPSRRCRITTRYYYDGMGFFLQAAARNIKFKGAGVSARAVKKARGWRVYEVKFSPLSRGQTRQIRVTYQLPAARPRSPNTTRVTDAYAHFCWYGQATDTGSVTAVLPRGYDTSTRYGQVRKKKMKGGVRLTAVRKRNPSKFYACTDAFDPSKLLRTETTSQNGRMVTVEGWPEDPAWTTSITTGIETTLPALEQLIGIRFPTDDVAIRQVASQALAGYAGDFDSRSGMIRVSEQLDDEQLVAHELAHAWFNFGTLKDAWMVEGLADWAGNDVADGECKDPGEYPGKGSPRLQEWRYIEGNPSDRDVNVIGYQYDTACTITETIAEAIGEEQMAVVIRSLLYRMPKYKGDWSRKQGRPAWREWLDAVDEIGLVPAGVADLEKAERLLVEQGIARKKELRGRSEARLAYHEAANGPLADAMPFVVREAMDAWKWDKAAKGIAIATETRTVAQALRDQGVTGSPLDLLRPRLVEARSLPELKKIRKEILAAESAQAAGA